jgi:hypothetical protein
MTNDEEPFTSFLSGRIFPERIQYVASLRYGLDDEAIPAKWVIDRVSARIPPSDRSEKA